jgi:hypothetical protein
MIIKHANQFHVKIKLVQRNLWRFGHFVECNVPSCIKKEAINIREIFQKCLPSSNYSFTDALKINYSLRKKMSVEPKPVFLI